MTRTWVRAAALLLAGALTAGCAPRDAALPAPEAPRGRYLETDVTPPRAPESNVLAFAVTRGGGVHLLESQWRDGAPPKLRHLVSVDRGESWREAGTQWADTFEREHAGMAPGEADITPDGEICFFAPDSEDFERGTLFYVPDEKTLVRRAGVGAESFPFGQFLPGGDWLGVSEEGDILRVSGDTGEERYRIRGTASYPSLFAVYGERFLCLPLDQSLPMTAHELDSGRQIEIPEASYPAEAAAPGPDGALYFISAEGVSRLTQGGSTPELLIEGARCSLGSPALTVDAMACAPDGTLYVSAHEGEEQRILRFSFDPDAPTLPSRELDVYALRESRTVRKALSDFTASRPDVLASLRTGADGQTAVSESDALRALNTELLAGRGPDVLLLDGLPLEAYRARGVLLDLGELARQDDLFGNVACSLESDGMIPAVPVRMRVPLMVGEAGLLARCATLEGLLEVAAAGKAPEKDRPAGQNPFIRREGEPPLFAVQRDTDPLRQLFYTSAPAVFTGRRGGGALDGERLAALLEAARPIARKYKSIGDFPPDELELDPRAECFSFSLTDYYVGNARMSLVNCGGIGSLSSGVPWPGPGETVEVSVALQCGMAEGAFLPTVIAGVNAASGETRTAKDFVSCLLSDSVQQFEFEEGFPVRVSTFERLAEQARADFGVTFSPDLAALVRSLETPVILDDTLFSALLEEGFRYLRGEAAVEETVEAVRTRVELYYAE